jgi:gamma-glutamyltranspeptidase
MQFVTGAIIGKEDLKQYKALTQKSLKVKLTNGYTIYAPESPSSGAILMFILNILDGKSGRIYITDWYIGLYIVLTTCFIFGGVV